MSYYRWLVTACHSYSLGAGRVQLNSHSLLVDDEQYGGRLTHQANNGILVCCLDYYSHADLLASVYFSTPAQ